MATQQDLIITGANILDTVTGEYEQANVHLKNGVIDDISTTTPSEQAQSSHATSIDGAGKFLIPGLIDSHVHLTAMEAELGFPARHPQSFIALHTAIRMKNALHRGFTTVRDAGGADFGYHHAVEQGITPGPRILFCGSAISQTGGHGDFRLPSQYASDLNVNCCPGVGDVADGVDEVRRVARDHLRKGAHHIKIMASGGVASPTDRVDSTQFSIEEIRAAVEEAEAANRYVAAHAYTARAINRALEAGVRSIEHGNLLDDSSLQLFKEKDAFLVPNLVAYFKMRDLGLELGMSADNLKKNDMVLEAGIEALKAAHAAGINIVYGTDLLADLEQFQSQEFAIRAEIQGNLTVLQQATYVPAKLINMESQLGQIKPGFLADLVMLDQDPLTDITALTAISPQTATIIARGAIVE